MTHEWLPEPWQGQLERENAIRRRIQGIINAVHTAEAADAELDHADLVARLLNILVGEE
jgi:hypothetical protein